MQPIGKHLRFKPAHSFNTMTQPTPVLPQAPSEAAAPSVVQPTIQVLGRMYALLDILSRREGTTSLKDLSERSGLHLSTTHRILNDLQLGGFVDRPEQGQYRLGLRLLELGNIVKGRFNVRDIALEPMRQLHQNIAQAVNLSVRQGDEIVYLERAYSERSGMQVVRTVGTRAPLHLTSTGKLFLAAEGLTEHQAYARRTGLKGHTRNSLTTLPALQAELERVRAQGLAHDNEELELGVRCMAVGIYDDQSALIAGLSISAPTHSLNPDWIPVLQATALHISKHLGYQRDWPKASA
jgi:IclR family transcriptional regulator, carbohydrate utilization repressor